MKALGENPTAEELDDFVKKIDIDGDGTIDYTEFLCK